MARLPALVSALAEMDGRDSVTVGHIARVVREAGLISTTKRGSGASPMTIRDAANLLIGANGTDAPKDAALAVQQFRTLLPRYHEAPDRTGVLGALDKAGSFGEALEALIEGSPELACMFLEYTKEAYSDQSPATQREFALGRIAQVGVEVAFYRPIGAEISIWRSPGAKHHIDHQWKFQVDISLFEKGFYDTRRPDRRVRSSFGFPTLLKTAGVIFDTDLAAGAVG